MSTRGTALPGGYYRLGTWTFLQRYEHSGYGATRGVLPAGYLGPVSQKILSPLVILSMEKTMVTMVISELKFIARLKIFRETRPWTFLQRYVCLIFSLYLKGWSIN